jgi:hypothetical protein
MKQIDPEIYRHLFIINSSPVKYAYKWLYSGFVNALKIDQWLLLWDRIIGYDDLSLLIIAAVSIFSHYKQKLLECNSDDQIQVRFSL